MSGADLEYQRMLAAAGVNPATPAGYDAARLEQMSDVRDSDERQVNLRELYDLVNTGRLSELALDAEYGTVANPTGIPETDTVVLQAAFTASSTTPQRLSEGTYIINAALTIPTGANIDFGNAIIQRGTGTGVYDMITATGTALILRNLVLDGNKNADGLVATNPADRFGGLVFNTVTDSRVDNITVTGTVNNELTAGLYFNGCSNIYATRVDGYANDRTAILLNLCDQITIDKSWTRNNDGSGISSITSPECTYTNILTHDNGYSNLSVNGLRCVVSNVISYNSLYSGVNVGHVSQPADDTVLNNIQSYGNTYEGITITNSARVKVTNFTLTNNVRHGIRTMNNANSCQIVNGSLIGNGGQGVYFESGNDNLLAYTNISESGNSGVYVNTALANTQIGPGVKAYNNGNLASANSAGILLNAATNTRIIGCETYDDQGTKTQESGIWIAGGTGHVLIGNRVENNLTYQVRTSSSPQYVMYEGTGSVGAARITGTSLTVATTTLGFYAVPPVARAAAITPPAGGATIDAESRTAIGLIITALKNIGLTS